MDLSASANEASLFASQVSELLAGFPVCDLRVVATAGKKVVVSGIVDNEEVKNAIQDLLRQQGHIEELHNTLMVMPGSATVTLTVNRQPFNISTLAEMQEVFARCKDEPFIEFLVEGYGESSLLLLLNSTSSLGIFFRHPGDSGFTTSNPGGGDEMQDFLLSNGQKDEYPAYMLTDRKNAFDIIRYYLLAGQPYPGIEWKEE